MRLCLANKKIPLLMQVSIATQALICVCTFPPTSLLIRYLPMPQKNADVLGIGNAIVDVIARHDDSFLTDNALD